MQHKHSTSTTPALSQYGTSTVPVKCQFSASSVPVECPFCLHSVQVLSPFSTSSAPAQYQHGMSTSEPVQHQYQHPCQRMATRNSAAKQNCERQAALTAKRRASQWRHQHRSQDNQHTSMNDLPSWPMIVPHIVVPPIGCVLTKLGQNCRKSLASGRNMRRRTQRGRSRPHESRNPGQIWPSGGKLFEIARCWSNSGRITQLMTPAGPDQAEPWCIRPNWADFVRAQFRSDDEAI